ncbi:MAG: transposase [Bacteroidetes bacterium]|nr:MAG: transposase [Bacteroidota bacterium]
MPTQAQRPDVVEERVAFQTWLETVDPAQVKTVDESGVVQGMRLAYGYAKRGRRLIQQAPLRQGKRISLLGWLGFDGAGMVAMHQGTVKRYHFRGFIQQHLLPQLKPGDIVLWDNARIHDAPDLVEQIEARGASVKPLPRYSPDYNPIEMLWSKLKHGIKKARSDTKEALLEAVEGATARVSASDARGWFFKCGFQDQCL